MSAEEFAKRVVAKALSPSPPFYMTLGKFSTTFTFLQWLPRIWVLRYFWKQFSAIKPKAV
jgi:hypothetical protein